MADKVGIFGGSFDPPHRAHLDCLKSIAASSSLSKIYIVPSKYPPGKSPVAPYAKRLEWCREIFTDATFDVVDWEAKSESTVFAKDLVLKLELAHPKDEWMWILGEDQLDQLPYWHQIDDYAPRGIWGVLRRAETGLRSQKRAISESSAPAAKDRQNLSEECAAEKSFPGLRSRRLNRSTAAYRWLEAPIFSEISSTEIRRMCEQGGSRLPKDWLPSGLATEIVSFYQNNKQEKGGKN